MVIYVNAEPSIVEARTFAELERKIPYGLMFSGVGSYCPSWGRNTSKDNVVYVYNIRKENKKTKQIKGEDGRTKKSEFIRKKRWIAQVYKFDYSFLEAAGLKVEQHKRNFTITKKRR